MRKLSLAVGLAAGLALTPVMVRAQGVPVIDVASIAQMIQQLQQMQQQYQQLKTTHASLNQITNAGQIASILNQSNVRNALPRDYAAYETALQGHGGGADQFYQKDSTYTSPSNSAYAAQIEKEKRATAGTKSIAATFYDAAGERAKGLQQLVDQIGQADSAAAKADLNARATLEVAAGQNDMARLQALMIAAQAQERADAQAKSDAWEKALDDVVASRKGR